MQYLQKSHGHFPDFLNTLVKWPRTASWCCQVLLITQSHFWDHKPGEPSWWCLQNPSVGAMQEESLKEGSKSAGPGCLWCFSVFLPAATVALVVVGRDRRLKAKLSCVSLHSPFKDLPKCTLRKLLCSQDCWGQQSGLGERTLSCLPMCSCPSLISISASFPIMCFPASMKSDSRAEVLVLFFGDINQRNV